MGSGGAYEIWYDGYANFGGEYDYPANVTASDVLTRFVTWQNSWSSSYKPNACEVVNKKLRSYNVFGGEYNTRYSYHWDAIGTLIKFAIPVAPFSSITMTIENYSLDCSWSLEDRELCGACRAKSLSRCIRLAGIDTVPANSSNTPHVAAVPSYSSLSAPLKVPSYASDMDLRENYGYGITPSVNKVTPS